MTHGTVVSINIAVDRGQPMRSVPQVRAVAGRGLEGDRFFRTDAPDTEPRPDRELTLIEAEAIEALAREHGVRLEPKDARRNIVTRGVALNDLVGREFTVGGVRLRGLRLCEPCAHLAQLTDERVLSGLVHRGGLRAQILNDGLIRVGDRVEPRSITGTSC